VTTELADRYQLGEVIGRGGMAEVRAGHDLRLDRPVAVKLLRSDIAHQPGVRQRFESEARLAARLAHPNVVAVYDSGETPEGVPFIVMERLPGSTLADRLRAGPLSEAEVRELARQVLSALQAAHCAGVMHRDVKPANILAAGGGIWKVGDFGIAKAVMDPGGDPTMTVALLGTPAYLAPERLHGAPATAASDIYSVGVVLYESLAGAKPLGTPLLAARAGVDPALAAAVERALAPVPDRRFASAAEMEAAIARGAQTSAADTAIARGAQTSGADRTTPGAAPTSAADTTIAAGTPTLVGPPPPPTGVLARPAGAHRVPLTRRSRALAALAGATAVTLIVLIALPGGKHASTGPANTVPAGLPSGLAHALQDLESQVSR
jgi:serine/threonine protein kinase